MSKKHKPNHRDAELVLRLYELRREAVMRESRSAIQQWLPKSYEDVAELFQPTHPKNAAWRQVGSYFEMAWGFARHGTVDPDLLAENTGEGFLLYAKIEPYLERLREEFSPTVFRNGEWLIAHSDSARERLEMFRKRVAGMLAAKS